MKSTTSLANRDMLRYSYPSSKVLNTHFYSENACSRITLASDWLQVVGVFAHAADKINKIMHVSQACHLHAFGTQLSSPNHLYKTQAHLLGGICLVESAIFGFD